MKLQARESVIFAEDFQAMIEWYQEVLGFKVSRLFTEDYHYCNLETETGIQIGIAPAEEVGVQPGGRRNNTIVLQFQVADVERFFAYLKAQGAEIAFGPSFDEKGQFWYGGFYDLEGNPFWVVDENCP